MDQTFEIYNTFGHNHATRRGEFVTQIIQGERTTLLRGSINRSTYVLTELTAILNALRSLPEEAAAVIYIHNPMIAHALVEGRIRDWEKNGWKTRHNRTVIHQELWKDIHQETKGRPVRYLKDL